MAIKVKRSTGWMGMLAPFKIKVDDETVEKIQIDIPTEETSLQASLWGVKTEQIKVKDGDYVEIFATKWERLRSLLFVGIILLNFIPIDGSIQGTILLGLIIYIIIDIVISMTKPGFNYNIRKI